MRFLLKSLLAGLLAVTLTVPPAVAQEARPAYSEEELHQMLAPIALYPDSLLTQILMAATYPLEVVQAARWSRANSQLKGEDAVNAVEAMDWDPSVKSLVAFPQILQRLDERLDWTQRLGEAFLAQEPHVLDAIQGLRQRAEAAGNLKSSEQMRVTRQDEAILIEPARPESVYVPYYDPAVVYGSWWYPAYPPVYWSPWPGYYAAPAFAPGFFWGPAIVVSTGFFFGHANFHHHHVTVHHKHKHLAHTHSRFGKPHTVTNPVTWKHNPVHRKGVPYRHADLRKQFGSSSLHGGAGRRDDRKPGAAPLTRNSEGGRPAGFRDSRSVSPAPRAQQRRLESGPENSRFKARSSAPQPAPGAPATRQAQRPDSNGNVLRFQGRMPPSQAAPAAPATRQVQRPDSNGNNNVLRFQGRIPSSQPAPAAPATRQAQRPDSNVRRFQGPIAPRPAPAAPAARQSQRPTAAAPARNVRSAESRPQLRPQASARGNHQSGRQMTAPRGGSPASQARGNGAAPRMGTGNFRGKAAGRRG